MNNILDVNGYKAIINFDPEKDVFRGEFVELNGSADFYATDVATLKQEAKTSLDVFLDECKKCGIQPKKQFSGKFVLRLSPEVHRAAVIAAEASGTSLNQWIVKLIEEAVVEL